MIGEFQVMTGGLCASVLGVIFDEGECAIVRTQVSMCWFARYSQGSLTTKKMKILLIIIIQSTSKTNSYYIWIPIQAKGSYLITSFRPWSDCQRSVGPSLKI